MKSLGAVASIAWSVERVHTLTIFADAREIGLPSRYLACLVSNGPIHEQWSLPTVMIIERRRSRVVLGEVEAGCLHKCRVAATAHVVDLRRVSNVTP